ncbi:MAG: prolipoprotein diacylglyceryl transferase [Opitutaceae bacterium]|nr:prolipoprotein diacylglyceryl transferase [Opitutaceae bacterium]
MIPMATWVHTWDPFLIKFSDNFGIRYYGLAYVLGFVGAAWMMIRYAKRGRTRMTEAQVSDLMMGMVFGVVIGGRLGYFLLYHFGELAANPLVLFKVWQGGMAFHGGLIGVAAAIAWTAWRQQIQFSHLADVVSSVASLGLLFGRIANFINGELWGRVTSVPWAVIFPASDPTATDVERILPRHPSQLYEAFLEGLVLLVFAQWRFWKTDVVARAPGRLCGEYLLAYGVARIVCEMFREPDATLVLGLSRGTFYSIFVMLVGATFLLRSRRRHA